MRMGVVGRRHETEEERDKKREGGDGEGWRDLERRKGASSHTLRLWRDKGDGRSSSSSSSLTIIGRQETNTVLATAAISSSK